MQLAVVVAVVAVAAVLLLLVSVSWCTARQKHPHCIRSFVCRLTLLLLLLLQATGTQ